MVFGGSGSGALQEQVSALDERLRSAELAATDYAAFKAATTATLTALQAGLSSFVNGGAALTVADLLSTFPASAANLFKYARVSDLYGVAASVMVCEQSAGAYYWRPQRTDFSAASTSTGGSVALVPLVSAPTIVFTGTLLGSVTVTPSSVNAWPGARFEVVANGTLGAFGININGLIGGGTVPVLNGSSRLITYVQGTGWRAG